MSFVDEKTMMERVSSVNDIYSKYILFIGYGFDNEIY